MIEVEVDRGPNAEQLQVILHGHGPMCINAGAGTGKTFTLTQRVVRLIRDGHCRPDQILALTFGNRAATQMRDRITEALLDVVPPDTDPPTVLTYNSFGHSVIAEWGGLIGMPPSPPLLSDAGCWLLLWDCLPSIDFRHISLLNLRGQYGSPLKDILDLAGRCADELVSASDLLRFVETYGDVNSETIDIERLDDYGRALSVYEQEKRRRGQIDYGDQIALAARALQLPQVRQGYVDRYRYVLVDEYQDTNFAQSAMVNLLTQDFDRRSVCVVGDVRQAIYRFRGAAPDNLLRFPDDYAESTLYSLQLNYRSTRSILAAANAVWNEAESDLVSALGREGTPVVACTCEDEETEWEWISRRIRDCHQSGTSYGDMAVLFRKNNAKMEAWRALTERGIPAVMTGGGDLYHTPEVRELISYLRALTRPGDNIALAHIASSDSFGLDEAVLYDVLGPLPRGRTLFDLMVERGSEADAPHSLRLFLATFTRLLSDAATLSPARVLERITGLRRGAYSDRQQSNVHRFQTVAEGFSRNRSGGPSLSSFVAYLNLLLSAPTDETEATDTDEEDAVQLMTAHAAKGLERAVIFVACASQPDFTVRNSGDTLPARLRHHTEGMPKADDHSESKTYESALKKWDSLQHRLEEQRLLYVALTRARDRLFISWHRLPVHYKKERKPLDALVHVLPLVELEHFDRSDWVAPEAVTDSSSLLDRAKVFVQLQTHMWASWSTDELAEGPTPDSIAGLWKEFVADETFTTAEVRLFDSGIHWWAVERPRLESLLQRCLNPAVVPPDAGRRPVVETPSTLSYSMLSTYKECGRKAYLRFVAGFPGEPRPWATGTGTAFHATIERVAELESGATLDDLTEMYRHAAAEARGSSDYRLTDNDRALLRNFWDGPDRFAVPIYVEQEFYWRAGPGYLHGFIDRIQRHQDGTVELIDFKTGRVALSPEDARQSLQLSIYALAAREVLEIELDRLTLAYPRLGTRVSIAFSSDDLVAARSRIVDLMEQARTASYDDVNTAHCSLCEYRLVCPAARK